jgi:4-alpha-glucanotransferase
MKFNRSSGMILHPTSLPGPYGIGEMGPTVLRWLDFLDEAGCSLWQVLPLGPTGYGDSPYQCFSAFAGNPYLISLEVMLSEGLVSYNDLIDMPAFLEEKVDFGGLIPWKNNVLNRAYQRFLQSASASTKAAYQDFITAQTDWLPDFALFMAIKESFGGGSWINWPEPLRRREPKALQEARARYDEAIDRHLFRQFLFFRQWSNVKAYAAEKEIQIIGDIPIFVAHDSADVWSHPELFFLDQSGRPSVVAGVPPDYFSATGQLWGNPLYRWEVHRSTNYEWWIRRFKAVLALVDIVRLDHFRGFAGYWEIPGDALTAEIGQWVPGPGADLFEKVQQSLGSLPIIAEDLGVITPDVVELREKFNLPGMKILQFAFASDAEDPFLPHNYPNNCVVYTGTHDNDTALGWYKRVDEQERAAYRKYFDRDGSNISWDLIRGVWASVAIFGLAPLQDFLSLDNEARMNYPGNPSGNWSWRMPPAAINEPLIEKIYEFNSIYGRSKPKNNVEAHNELPEKLPRQVEP